MQKTDSRGNTILTDNNIIGWTEKVTDAAGNITTTEYDFATGQPSRITDACGKAACYAYDIRGRKIAEWGTAIQPAAYAYDAADRLVSLTTWRAAGDEITTAPTGRIDGDVTTWDYDEASGLIIRKSYPDGSHEDTEYNALNFMVKKTDARNIATSYIWDADQGICTRISFSDGTPDQQFTYNQLGMLIKVEDASGARDIAYTASNEPETEAITVNENRYAITKVFDSFGRTSGYSLTLGMSVMDIVGYGYGTYGQLVTTSFMHEGEIKTFTCSYLPGSGLLQSISHPNSIHMTRTYEAHRDLISSMRSTRDTTDVALRGYTYDELGRPITRTCLRQDKTRDDRYSYNERSELLTASLGAIPYSYSYDNIGNRQSAQEAAETVTAYVSNRLNQYISISPADFVPEYDAAGNQTKFRSSTGIWSATYDANNRPTRFVSQDGQTVIECGYDYLGRRFMKKVTVSGVVTVHHRYLYRGYLQIAALDLMQSNLPFLWFIHWDPTEPVATRPLSIRKNGTWYTYGHDLTKNVTELYKADGNIATSYDYAPFGAVRQQGVDQPLQWSCEIHDCETGLVYYNYRHYNPQDGRWLNRDRLEEVSSVNLYRAFANQATGKIDLLGMECNYPEQPLTPPKSKKNCKPRTFIFIGGASDDTYGNMGRCKKAEAGVDPNNTYSYYHQATDPNALAQTIQDYQKKCPKTKVVLVGHSWGGDTAMDVAEALEGTGQKVTLVTLDAVSAVDNHNLSITKPDSVDYWVNAYIGKGAGDMIATVPGPGQIVGAAVTWLTTFSGSNTVATLGGKWGHESGADVNIKFPLYGSTKHVNARNMYINTGNNLGHSSLEYLNNHLR